MLRPCDSQVLSEERMRLAKGNMRLMHGSVIVSVMFLRSTTTAGADGIE